MALHTWRNRLLLDLPMRSADHDPVNGWTVNRGRAGSTLDGVFGAGVAEPTKLSYRRGYSFDGIGHIQCSAGYQNTTGLISIMVALMPDTLTTLRTIFGWETVGGDTVGILQYVDINDSVCFYCGSVAGPQLASATGASWGYVAGTLHTITGIHDGTDTLLYIDGNVAGSAATPLAPDATSNPMYVGARGNAATRYVGDIYHVGMADFALSPHQVRQYHDWAMRRINQK